ncbi:MAG: hypothetical protein FWC00_02370 [Firmicutes bacterium]|nr:hypothetical protein [Bacillota bacterium]
MFNELFGRFGGGCGCASTKQASSCDVMWIIILLMIVFRGGLFGLDICTLVILFIVFGKDLLCCDKNRPAHC